MEAGLDAAAEVEDGASVDCIAAAMAVADTDSHTLMSMSPILWPLGAGVSMCEEVAGIYALDGDGDAGGWCLDVCGTGWNALDDDDNVDAGFDRYDLGCT